MSAGQRLGSLLKGAGLITTEQLEEALALQEQQPDKRIGQLLIELGHVMEHQVTQVLSNQLSVAWVSLDHVIMSPELLSLVSGELAAEHTLIPVHFRRGKQNEKILYVAMDDPTNVPAMERISEVTGMHIRPLIAPPSDIRRAIREHYATGDG